MKIMHVPTVLTKLLAVLLLLPSCRPEDTPRPEATFIIRGQEELNRLLPQLSGLDTIRYLELTVIRAEDLSFLSGVQHIDHLLLTTCRELRSLEGLESCRSIDMLDIVDCPLLQSMDALEQTQVASRLNLVNLPELRQIPSSLTGATLDNLRLLFCDFVRELQLDHLSTVTESLIVGHSRRLENIDLPGLSTIGDELGFLALPNLHQLHFSEALTGLPILSIQENGRLADLDAFATLQLIEELQVVNNAALTDISGLAQLQTSDYIQMRFNGITDYCPLKQVVTNNPMITLDILHDEQMFTLQRNYFVQECP